MAGLDGKYMVSRITVEMEPQSRTAPNSGDGETIGWYGGAG